MDAIDAKVGEYQMKLGQLRDHQRMLQRQADAVSQDARVLEARIQGLIEARALLSPAVSDETPTLDSQTEKVETPPSAEYPRRRRRRLTGHWQEIMQYVDSPHGFDYAALAEAVEAVGHDANRETLRSQMSIYKNNGFVESIGDGSFKLTPMGRAAAGIISNSGGSTSSNENGPPEGGPDAGEVSASPLEDRLHALSKALDGQNQAVASNRSEAVLSSEGGD